MSFNNKDVVVPAASARSAVKTMRFQEKEGNLPHPVDFG
jgi:hypothetical protein